ncbi:MAG TPA: glucose dehydrogenase, partial [Runella sp.]|nr:glucose dehydrogenase [Runella sp.]
MKNTTPLAIIVVTLNLLSACTEKQNETTTTVPEPELPVAAQPVETNPANTSYKPAFSGQTRVGGVKTTTPYKVTLLTSALSAPWGITPLPDGRLLVTEKSGRMRIVTASGTVSTPITGIPTVNAGGQGGLLGVCVSPSFATDRMIYWVFSENVTGGTVTAVAKGK